VNTVGDVKLLPLVLDSISRFTASTERPPATVMQRQLERMRMQNLFTQPWV
jgi:hypothetical protein